MVTAEPEITYSQARQALERIARERFEKKLRPEGEVHHFNVFDPRRILKDLPAVGVRLYVNGTWEYEDGTPAGGAEN